MPTLHRIWKEKIINHHHDVAFKVLDHEYSYSNGKKNKWKQWDWNMIIHWDNLEALKSLLPKYEWKIKCIYIDPPYNTGNEWWVYNDNSNHPKIKKWLGEIVGKEWEDLSRHDKRICMMYPRLKLLHKLLRDDGIIFVSIDDNEQAHLRLLMDEIFWEKNHISTLIWNTDGHTDNQYHIKENHEYVHMYFKEYKIWKYKWIWNVIDPNTREESNLRKWYAENSITKNGTANPPSKILLPIWFPSVCENAEIEATEVDSAFFEEVDSSWYISRDLRETYNLKNKMPIKFSNMIIKDWKLKWECYVYSWWANKNKLLKFIKNWCKPYKEWDDIIEFYLSANWVIYYKKHRDSARNILSVLRNFKTTEQMRSEIESYWLKFNYPKPNDLIEYLIKIWSTKDDIVLDSFAWSWTTAHAVLNLNKQDGGNRKYILIELEDYAEEITAERVKRVIDWYGEWSKSVEWTWWSFDFYWLWEPLFLDEDTLNENLPLGKIREYVWFTETKSDVPVEVWWSLLWEHHGTQYHFHYDKSTITTLNHDFLSTLSESEQYVIYADLCALDDEFMIKHNIIFKKIPRDISRF